MVVSPLCEVILCKLNKGLVLEIQGNMPGIPEGGGLAGFHQGKTNAPVPTQRDESMTKHTSWCHPHSAEERKLPPLLSLSAAEGPSAGVSAPAPALSSPPSVRIGLLQPQEAFLGPAAGGYSVAIMAAGLLSNCLLL